MIVLGAAYGALGLLTYYRGIRKSRSWEFAVGTLAIIVILALSGVATRHLPQATLQPGERLVSVDVSREGVVATVECAPDDWRTLFNNSYTLGGSRAQVNQERQAHLPILLHGHAQRLACLGIATGSTVAGATLHSHVERIEAIELSPAVIEHAAQFFAPYNRRALEDGRVKKSSPMMPAPSSRGARACLTLSLEIYSCRGARARRGSSRWSISAMFAARSGLVDSIANGSRSSN
jgi:hypothetical protein